MLSIKKEVEKVSTLITRKIPNLDVSIDVEMLVDVSGSTHKHFSNGKIEEIFQRTMAFSDRVDPDKKVGVTAFSDEVVNCGDFPSSQFDQFIVEFMRKANKALWGGTFYHLAFESLIESVGNKKISFLGKTFNSLFGKSAEVEVKPKHRLVVFITDGQDQGSRSSFEKAVKTLIDDGHTYIMAIGVGEQRDFACLEELDKKFHGFNFHFVSDYEALNDDSFYEIMLSDEFVQWYKERVK